MKRLFLKGKQYLNKKLEELQISTEELDVVQEQIPVRLKKPLSVLRSQIDLESNQQYYPYFKNHPRHYLSSYLLQKHQMLVDATEDAFQYKLPTFNDQRQDKKAISIKSGRQSLPRLYEQLEKKAICLREVIEEYDEGCTRVEEPVVCMAVIQFHHKRGTEVEYIYPHTRSAQAVQPLIIHHSMPDSSHNKSQDYNFFNFQGELDGKKTMLFGVSCFKQLRVTEEMRNADKQLTRSFVQKAVAVVSSLPLFGYLKLRLMNTTRLFFQDFSNYRLIDMAYQDISRQLGQTWMQLAVNEVYIGSDLRTIGKMLGPSQLYEVWKAILHERRVVVFAHSPSSASSFILSLLSLFPGASFFGMYSRPIAKHMQALREYALPLLSFSTNHFLLMSFHVQDFHLLAQFQGNCRGSFLVGTTNRLLKESNDYGIQLLVNLEDCTLHRLKPRTPWEPLTKPEKLFISQLDALLNAPSNIQYSGGEDVLRNHFHSFLKSQLLQMIKAVANFHTFLANCQSYKAQRKKSPRSKSKEQYTQIEEEIYVEVKHSQFPPLPQEVEQIPFPNLLLCASFAHFLQFHNKNLPACIEGKITPCLLIDGYQYYVRLPNDEFIWYNWLQKKLTFGRGRPRNFEGKELRFSTQDRNIVKSVYLGAVENGRYNKSGLYFDNTERYEGDFIFGSKEGYGKLTNPLYEYIGNFSNDLCNGFGQMIEGKNIYNGEFREGLRHGTGRSQGQFIYEGEWNNNYAQGSGMQTIDGNRFVGTFKKGMLDQSLQVTIRYNNGAFYKGFIKDYKKEGRGYYLDENQQPFAGFFTEDKFYQSIDTINVNDHLLKNDVPINKIAQNKQIDQSIKQSQKQLQQNKRKSSQ